MAPSIDQIIVQEEQLVQLLSWNTKTSISNSILAFLLFYVQVDVLPLWVGITWLASILTINTVRFFIGRQYINNPAKDPQLVHKRLNLFRVGLIVSALIWGINSFLVNSEHLYEQQVFVAYMLAGLTAGAALVYSIDLICALAFTVVTLLPMLICFTFSGNPFLLVMSIAGFTYILFLVISLKTFNRGLIESVLLRAEAVRNAEEIKQLAFYDVLTGLPNRRLLLERLERSFSQSWRTGKHSAVLFLDLDHFKKLNDTLGHDMGDELLKQVAERLKESVRESDTVSRFGGDEFVLILENLNGDYQLALKEIDQITKLMLANLNQTYHLTDVDYMSSSSVGVAMMGEHGRTQQELLKHADIAMYHAKQSGRNAVSIYDSSMQKTMHLE